MNILIHSIYSLEEQYDAVMKAITPHPPHPHSDEPT